MAFDESTAVAAPQPSGFDPTSAKLAFDEGTAQKVAPADALKTLAPLVARPDAKPADDQAYIDAYKEHYEENPRLHALGDVASFPFHHPLAATENLGAALWGTTKAIAQGVGSWANKAVSGGPAPGSVLDQFAAQGKELGVMGKGALAGGVSAGRSAMGLLLDAGEQLTNAVADAHGANSDELRTTAAKAALLRLKESARDSQVMAGFTDQATGGDPRKQAMFGLGNAGAQAVVGGAAMAPAMGVVAPIAGGAAKAAGVAGDFIKTGLWREVGGALQAGPTIAKVGNMAANTGAAGLAVTGAVTSPTAAVSAAVLGRKSAFSTLAAVKSALFQTGQAAGVLGDQLVATPIGQNVIDSLAANAPAIIQKANQENLAARVILKQAQKAYTDAYDAGLPTRSYAKAVKQASTAVEAADTHSWLMEKGANTVTAMQGLVSKGLPKPVANAIAGAVHGGLVGGAVGALQSKPGDDKTIANGMSAGIFYGGLLSMLGTAASAAKARGAQPAPTPAPNAAPPVINPATAHAPNGAPSAPVGKPPATVIEPGTVTDLRKAVSEKATHTFVIDGVPHDTQVFADTLKNTAKAFSNAAAKENPLETYKLQTEPAVHSEEYPTMLSDQQVHQLVALHKPVKSSMITHIGYDPASNAWSGIFVQPGAKGTIHYVGPDMLPEEFNQWMAAKETEGSIGKYFNKYVLKKFPVLRVRDNVLPQASTAEPGAKKSN